MWQPGNGGLGGSIGQNQSVGGGSQLGGAQHPPGWGAHNAGAQIHDTGVVYDNYLLSGSRGTGNQAPKQPGGPRRGSGNAAGRRQKNYRRLWEQIKAVGRGDGLDVDGRGGLPGPELSVEELVRMVSRLPPDVPCIPHVAPSLQYLDSRAFAAFMKDLAKNGHVARAMELFDWIKDLGPTHELAALADVYTYTTAINNAGQAQQLRRALELVGEMRTRGIPCNVHTYSALMNVCIKCDACELALDVFKEMRTDGVRPNVVTYNTLVDVYGKIGQWERAVRVLEDMTQDGLEPEVRTFNTAIIACNMCGQPQEALKVYARLLEAGLQPISTTYTALISAYAKGGQLDRALDTFKQMVREGCERSVITYSALINACEKSGQWELALQLFERMQQEGIAPNTVTYNSLITACTQGSQWEKASEVFDHMRFHNVRPDTVTYSALIGAYEKGGQWLRAVKAFEAMQGQSCRPDSSIYQAMVDMLWQSGVAWLQARALQLYATAARSWQFRFTVQQASPADPALVEFIVPASTASVAVLSAHRWLCELRAQLDRDGSLMLGSGGNGDRVAISLGRGRHTREQGCGGIRRALFAMLDGLGSPFRALDAGVAGGPVTAEAPTAAFIQWLSAPDLPQALSALLLPAVLAGGQQPAAAGGRGDGKRCGSAGGASSVDVCQSDAAIEAQCAEAFNTVAHFELTHPVDVEAMAPEYLQARSSYMDTVFAMAEGLSLRSETAHDAALLMDRVMATGTALTDGLSRLFAAAALRIAALQGEASDNVPTDATLAAGSGFPPGTVAKMEVNVRAALGNDTSAISALRCLKLFLERMGHDLTEGAPLGPLHLGAYTLLREAVRAPALAGVRPSAVAAAVLIAARGATGHVPAWPTALARLTGVRDTAAPEVAAAIATVDPIARAAAAAGALRLPPGSIPIVSGAGLGPGGSSGGGGPSHGGGGLGSGSFGGSSGDLSAGIPMGSGGGYSGGSGAQLWDAVRKQRGGGGGGPRSSGGAPSRVGTPGSDLSAVGPAGGRGASMGDLAALLHSTMAATAASQAAAAAAASSIAGSLGAGAPGSGPLPIPIPGRLGNAALSQLSAYGSGSLAGSPALRLPADPMSAAGLAAALSGLALGGAGAGGPGSAGGSPSAAAAAALAASTGLVGGGAAGLSALGGFGALGGGAGGMGMPLGGLGAPFGVGSPQLAGLAGLPPGLLGGGTGGLDAALPPPAQSRLAQMTSAHQQLAAAAAAAQAQGVLDAAGLLGAGASAAPGGPAGPLQHRHSAGGALPDGPSPTGAAPSQD